MSEEKTHRLEEFANILVNAPMPLDRVPELQELLYMYQASSTYKRNKDYYCFFVWLFWYGYIEGKRAERAKRKGVKDNARFY
jgi:hypothetical protein